MNPAHGLMGLCARSGRLPSGDQAVRIALKRSEVYLVLLDGAASPATRKDFTEICLRANIPIRLTDADALGEAIGKPGRRVAAVTDEALARRLAQLLPEDA